MTSKGVGTINVLTNAGDDPSKIGMNATILYQCLNSVPLVADDALQYLDYAKVYASLDTNIPYLKSPPSSWQQPSSDILAALDAIKKKVHAGFYETQYDFDAELLMLARTANDFHFNLGTGVLGSSNWAWSLPEPLTSFSVDGNQLPKVYVYNDITLAGNQS